MTKARAKIFLIVFGNLLIFVLGVGIFLIWQATGWSFGLVGLIPGIAHTAVSVAGCRRFKRRFEIMPRDYVMYGAAPAFLIGLFLILVGFVAVLVMGGTGVAPSFIVIAAFPTVYSILYMTILSIAAAYIK